MTVHEILNRGVARLERAGVPDARRSAEYLVQHVVGLSRAQLFAYPEQLVDPDQEQQIEGLLRRRLEREPVQYILGFTEFYGRRFEVTPDVLIPRPETEELVELALAAVPANRAARVLDIGTGSGCIAVTIGLERTMARVTGCDISAAALSAAERNSRALGADIHFIQADVFDDAFAEKTGAPFDVVVSNPPYVPEEDRAQLAPEVVGYEPHAALFPGADPLRFYRRLAALRESLLTPRGSMILETHDTRLDELEVFRQQTDLAGRLRFAVLP